MKYKYNKEVILFVSLILISLTPFLFTRNWSNIDFSKTGEIGDTIGGITAPFVNVLASILVYLSFKEQIRANNLLSKESNFQYINDLHSIIKEDISEFINHDNHYIEEVTRVVNQNNTQVIFLGNDDFNIKISTQKLFIILEAIENFNKEVNDSKLSSILKNNYLKKIKIQFSLLSIYEDGLNYNSQQILELGKSELVGIVELYQKYQSLKLIFEVE